MDKLITLTACEDGSCCCIPPRLTVALISILSMVVCLADILSHDASDPCCPMKDLVETTRLVLTCLFQMANLSLLVSSIVENVVLVNIYVWYTLAYVVMGLCVAILGLLYRVQHEGRKVIVSFASEVVFLFVISRCLPVVNTYRKHLDRVSARVVYK